MDDGAWANGETLEQHAAEWRGCLVSEVNIVDPEEMYLKGQRMSLEECQRLLDYLDQKFQPEN